MKNSRIVVEDSLQKGTVKTCIEWAIQDLDRAENKEEFDLIWARYPALHDTAELKLMLMKWALDDLEGASSMEEIKKVWFNYEPLHEDRYFRIKINEMKMHIQ